MAEDRCAGNTRRDQEQRTTYRSLFKREAENQHSSSGGKAMVSFLNCQVHQEQPEKRRT